MTEAAQQSTDGYVANQAGVPNRVVNKVRVRMLDKDLADYEKELETSRLAPENTGQSPSSEAQVNPEKPNSANNSQPQQQDNNWQKRYSDLQSHTDKKVAEVNKTLAAKEQELTELRKQLQQQAQAKKSYPVSEQDLEQWVKEFPPLLGIIQTIALKAFDERSQEVRQEFKKVEELTNELASEKGRAELLKIHPDANEIETDPRFAHWFNEQESEIQQLVASKNPKKIAKAISLFKKDLNIVTKTVEDLQREASRAVNLGPTPADVPQEQKVWHESEVGKMSIRQYAKYEKEIELARKEGRFVYDISRA
jgi:hypothetical protein